MEHPHDCRVSQLVFEVPLHLPKDNDYGATQAIGTLNQRLVQALRYKFKTITGATRYLCFLLLKQGFNWGANTLNSK